MNTGRNHWMALIVCLTVGGINLLSCAPANKSEPADIQVAQVAESEPEAASGPPPLIVDTSEPLLLDENTELLRFRSKTFSPHVRDEYRDQQHPSRCTAGPAVVCETIEDLAQPTTSRE